MRRIMLWIMVALLALTACASAESTASSVNGEGAARTASELYTIFSENGKDVLVRISSSGAAVCVDRADDIDSVVPYVGGMAYLKTDAGVSEIVLCSGNNCSVMYHFDGMTCTNLSVYGDTLLVLSDNLLYSVDPNDQICLKLSGAQILDYCVGGNYAYFLSGTDMMKYSADVTENGETVSVTSEVGCIYRLDLTSGETMLMLKSGGTDLKLQGSELFFHSMQQIYAVHNDNGYALRGKLYSLNVSEKNLNAVSSENDIDYWPLENGTAIRTENSIALTGNESRTLYTPEENAQVVSDGSALYVWEPNQGVLTRVAATGLTEAMYSGSLSDLPSISTVAVQTTPEPTPEPSIEPAVENTDAQTEGDIIEVTAAPSAIADPADNTVDFIEPLNADASGDASWFDDFMEESQNVSSVVPEPTPIGAEPTPDPWADAPADTSAHAYTTPIPDSQIETIPVSYTSVTIVDSASNMRNGPGTSFDKIGSIPQGKTVALLGLSAKSVTNGTIWYKVSYNGMVGWVSSMYAKPGNAKVAAPAAKSAPVENGSSETTEVASTNAGYAYINGGTVNVRSLPSLDGEVLAKIPAGKFADFSGKYSTDDSGRKWYKVTYNGVTGWVSAKYATITETKSKSTTNNSETSSGSYVRTTGDVTIRKAADKSSKALGWVSSGTKLSYLGSSKVDSRGVRWYKIRYDGITGWVSSKYAKLK